MRILLRLWPFIRPYRSQLILAFFLTGVLTLVGMTPPILLRYIIDEVISNGRWSDLTAIGLAFLSINILSAAGTYWNYLLIYLIGHQLVFTTRFRLYQHIQTMSLGFYDEMGTGKIMNRIMGDVARIQNLVTWNTVSLINDLISFVFGIGIIFYFSVELSLVTLALLPFYVLNYSVFVRRIRSKNLRVWRQLDDVTNRLQERLRFTRLVRSFARETGEIRNFTSKTRNVYATSMESTVLSATFSGASGLLSGLGYTVIYCLGCYYVILGKMTYGEVAAFGAFVFRVLSPAVRFTEVSNLLEQTSVSAERIFEILDRAPTIVEAKGAPALPPIRGHVRFRNVSFHYVPDEPVLRGVDLEVQPGETVALVGSTGCGKTTLTSLLTRFYDVCDGSVEIDGHDVRDVRVGSLRGQIGAVLQESILFSATILDNLRYAAPEASLTEIIAAARSAEAHELIMSKPDGYDTRIGEGGIQLSVGERQRLTIARAILRDPAILVLDEATSSLDSQSEALIQIALERVLKGRTSFVIAHRLATVVNADMIVVMDSGKIVERGPHRDLIEIPDGHYRRLYEEQFETQLEREKV